MTRKVRPVRSVGNLRTERQKKAEITIYYMVYARIVVRKNCSEQNGPVQSAEQKEQLHRKNQEVGSGIKY